MATTITELHYGYMPRGPNGKMHACERCWRAPARFLVSSQRWWWWPWAYKTQYICDACILKFREVRP